MGELLLSRIEGGVISTLQLGRDIYDVNQVESEQLAWVYGAENVDDVRDTATTAAVAGATTAVIIGRHIRDRSRGEVEMVVQDQTIIQT